MIQNRGGKNQLVSYSHFFLAL